MVRSGQYFIRFDDSHTVGTIYNLCAGTAKVPFVHGGVSARKSTVVYRPTKIPIATRTTKFKIVRM